MATATVNITYATVRTRALRNLQVMGKRLFGNDGKAQFTKVTVGTAEYPLIDDFIRKATHDVTARLADLVTAYSESDTAISFTVTNSRWDNSTPHLAVAFQNAVIDYVITMTISEYYFMYFSEQSQFNAARAAGLMRDIERLAFEKVPQTSSLSIDTSSSATVVTNGDSSSESTETDDNTESTDDTESTESTETVTL